jgi:hypothetical protein
MKMGIALVALGGAIGLAGCYNPPYSYDVRGNGEGGVVINHVPKRQPNDVPPPTPPPPPQVKYVYVQVPATAPAPPAPPPPATQPSDEQRIRELEARVKALADENRKLKEQVPATAPATDQSKE